MRVVIVGLGSIAEKHIRALRVLAPGVQILALRSSRTAAPAEGITDVYSWGEVGARPDFVLISNPTSLHGAAIAGALSLGCPLFIEKPVLAHPADAMQLLSLIEGKNILTYIACNLRFHPVIGFLRRYLAEQAPRINEVNVYCGSDLSRWRPGQDYTRSYSADPDLGGGVHLDLIHEVDYCHWLFGAPSEVLRLQRKVSDLQIRSIDFASYHLLYEQFTVNIVLNYYRKQSKRGIEIVSEAGELEADLLKAEVQQNGAVVFSDPSFAMEQTYQAQLAYFLEHIRSGRQPMNGFGEALDILKIAVEP